MKKYFLLLIMNLFAVVLMAQSTGKYVLVIHGGAGTILKSHMTP
jgi:hypothetical protein